ncbi:MAG TPA: hypothetical protein VFA65_09600 [Bryobacteraceae bacterium]|nr:hypothetical protein [Bryobacteraceae bacterium]
MFKKVCSLATLAAFLLVAIGCTPAQENEVVNDLDAIVNFGAALLKMVQQFGVADTPQVKADAAKAEQLAQVLDQDASQGIDEWNSNDLLEVKISKTAALFTNIPDVSQIKTAQIAAAVALLSASVQTLLAYLQTQTAASQLASERRGKSAWRKLTAVVPGTMQYKLFGIQRKADANAELAQKLLAARY